MAAPVHRSATESLIHHTPGVCGGRACVRNMRFPVWQIVEMKQLGYSDKDILEGHPQLTADDLAAARAYYAANKTEIDYDLAENADDAD